MCLLLDKGAGNRLEWKRPALKASVTGEWGRLAVPRASGANETGWRLGAGRGQGGRAEGEASEVSRASAAPTARSPKPPARPRPKRWRLDGRRDARARARAAGDERQRPKNEIQPPRAPPKAERQGEATGEMRAPHQTKSEPFWGSLTIFLCTEHQVSFFFHLDSNWMGVPSYHKGLKCDISLIECLSAQLITAVRIPLITAFLLLYRFDPQKASNFSKVSGFILADISFKLFIVYCF